MGKLEDEFRKVVSKVLPQIEAKLAAASKLISQAEKLADKHGVPFCSSVSPLGQEYVPGSFGAKFGGLRDPDLIEDEETEDDEADDDEPGTDDHEDNYYELMEDILGFTPNSDNEGWEHSAVC